MKKLWVAAPVVVAAPLVLAVLVSAASKPSPGLDLSRTAATTSTFAAPTSVTVSSVTPTWATVRFVVPSADMAAASEQVVVFFEKNGTAIPAFRADVTQSQVTATGLQPGTNYYAEVSVNGANGYASSPWQMSQQFTTTSESAATAPTASATTAAAAVTATPTTSTSTSTTPIAISTAPVWTTPTSVLTTTGSTATATPTATTSTTPASTTSTAASSVPTSVTTTVTATPTTSATPTDTASATPTDTASATPTPSPTTSATSTPSPTTSTSTPATGVPYASALSSYGTLAQSYSASDIVTDGWAQDANNTDEGGGTCPVANTTYSSALDAVVLSTNGEATTTAGADCGHIRSQYTVPTSGDVVEAKIWLPGLSSATAFGGSVYQAGTLLDWASMWTDGANSTNGTENWPADTEVDAVETQYGTNYVSVHYGSVSSTGGSTGDWTTEPSGWEGAGAIYATSNANVPNVQAGWNVVDIEFTSTVANIYYNGELFTTVPASVLSHDPAYLNFGISGPNGSDANSGTWPEGRGTEDVQYVKVFS